MDINQATIQQLENAKNRLEQRRAKKRDFSSLLKRLDARIEAAKKAETPAVKEK